MRSANWAVREFCLSTPRGPISTTIFGHGLKVLRACRQDKPHAFFSAKTPRGKERKDLFSWRLCSFAPWRAKWCWASTRRECASESWPGRGTSLHETKVASPRLRLKGPAPFGGRRSGADSRQPGAGLRFLEFWNTAAQLASTFHKTASLSPFVCGQAWKHRHFFGWHLTMKPEFTT
jgi:hypothetical protein